MGELEPHAPFIRYLLSVDLGDPGIAMMDGHHRALRGRGGTPIFPGGAPGSNPPG